MLLPIYNTGNYQNLQDAYLHPIINGLNGLQYLDGNATPQNWLQLVYPCLERNEITNEPQMYSGSKNDYVAILPDDRVKSFSFFYLNSPIEMVEPNTYIFDVSLVVWYVQNRLGKFAFPILSTFAKVVNDFLIGQNIKTSQIYTRPDEIFEYFDYKLFAAQTMPFGAFRISFQSKPFVTNCLPNPLPLPLIAC